MNCILPARKIKFCKKNIYVRLCIDCMTNMLTEQIVFEVFIIKNGQGARKQ